jgi:hypothetical protein
MKKLGIATALVSLAAVAAPGLAAAGDDVRSNGKCTGSSTAKIKAKARDGKLEVEFEVDQNKNGVPWKVKIKDNGDVQFRGTAKTKAPSGSFSIEKRIADQPGTDSIKGIGRNEATGERCVAELKI